MDLVEGEGHYFFYPSLFWVVYFVYKGLTSYIFVVVAVCVLYDNLCSPKEQKYLAKREGVTTEAIPS